MSADLRLTGVRAGYGGVEVLHGVDLDVPARGITALLGRNGAGKSTTLAAVAGLVPVRDGSVSWRGIDVTRWSVRRRAAEGMLLVPERRGVFTDLSVADNLDLFAVGADERARLADVHAAFPVLQQRLGQRAGSLSGGEQQMLAIARALVRDPKIILLDEPFEGLAPVIVRDLMQACRDLAAAGQTIVLVEQNLAATLTLAQRIYIINNGHIVHEGPAQELRAQPELLQRYIGV
jgi:branched-chain amino acid transport system ATP-binding protein